MVCLISGECRSRAAAKRRSSSVIASARLRAGSNSRASGVLDRAIQFAFIGVKAQQWHWHVSTDVTERRDNGRLSAVEPCGAFGSPGCDVGDDEAVNEAAADPRAAVGDQVGFAFAGRHVARSLNVLVCRRAEARLSLITKVGFFRILGAAG